MDRDGHHDTWIEPRGGQRSHLGGHQIGNRDAPVELERANEGSSRPFVGECAPAAGGFAAHRTLHPGAAFAAEEPGAAGMAAARETQRGRDQWDQLAQHSPIFTATV
jgi:hypothetical protein